MKINHIHILVCCLVLAIALVHTMPQISAGQVQSPQLSQLLQPPRQPGITVDATAAKRVLLIPLDDRPPCLQFPVMIGRIADTEVVTPPRTLLGRFTQPGDTQKIAEWIVGQNLRAFDAIIVSIDMLAYGGLVNSRIHRTPQQEALERLELLSVLHRVAPRLPIYGFNVVMRLAPTGDGSNDAYRDRLTRWAEISPYAAQNPELKKESAALGRTIPIQALSDYKLARARNRAINRRSIEMVRGGVIDYLILSQDDARPRGVHVAERERLIQAATQAGLSDKIAVQPGADEVAMLLLARALNKGFNYRPRIRAVYSSDATRQRVMPFEDQPLHRTVSLHIKAAGAQEVTNSNSPANAANAANAVNAANDVSKDNADILFYVYASRAEAGRATAFAQQIERETIGRRRQVIVADIDPRGDVQGGDPIFTEELRKRGVFGRLAGYASWNTAGNTIGTALPHGVLYWLALQNRLTDKPNPDSAAERIGSAQLKFLLHRLIDDYLYHSIIRPEAKQFAAANNLNANNLMAGEQQTRVEDFIRERLRTQSFDFFKSDFANRPFTIERSYGDIELRPQAISDFKMSLPWGRTFEAEVDFSIDARVSIKGPPIQFTP